MAWRAGRNNRNTLARIQTSCKLALPLPKGTPVAPVGMKALTVGPDPVAPFTREDVAAYFENHNLPRNLDSKADIQVEGLGVGTCGSALRRCEERLSSPALLRAANPFKFDRAYAIFDASSGNLLMAGTLDAADQQPR